MVKSLQKWLEKSGYNPEKIKLFGGGEALEVSTPYQGQTPTTEQFAILARNPAARVKALCRDKG